MYTWEDAPPKKEFHATARDGLVTQFVVQYALVLGEFKLAFGDQPHPMSMPRCSDGPPTFLPTITWAVKKVHALFHTHHPTVNRHLSQQFPFV